MAEQQGDVVPKKARKRVAAGGGTASEIRQVLGPDACADLDDRLGAHMQQGQTALKQDDLLDLIRHALLNHNRPPFLALKFHALVRHVLVLAHDAAPSAPPPARFAEAHGALLATPLETRMRLARAFGGRPGGVRSLLYYADDTANAEGGEGARAPEQPAAGLEALLASAEEMREAGYPEARADERGDCEGAATQGAQGGAEPPPRLLALDCEMVGLACGRSALARVSVVDAELAVLYDELVKPDGEVADYRTAWSGMTEARLRDATLSAASARAAVRALLRPRDVLVGHSLENDLRALGMAHCRCADTALLFPHPHGGGRKRKLAHLAGELLGQSIQRATPSAPAAPGGGSAAAHGAEAEAEAGGAAEDGHDSVADARACMQLVLRRLRDGGFGARRQRAFLTVPQLMRVFGPPAEPPGCESQPLRCAHFDCAPRAAAAAPLSEGDAPPAASAFERARAHLLGVGTGERRTLTWVSGPHSAEEAAGLLRACPANALVVALVPDGLRAERECAMTLAIRRPGDA